ncbi:O-antigen ligase family protein [Streptomyces sp. NPDC047022]|uniref:O-antigen ligase family protein n=1 Tax=Streptomyces sp. NPDC047022 TaxID=3155737 RepID=UPI0033CF85A9
MGSTGTASAAQTADAEGERRGASDTTGVLLLGACAGWSLITAAAHGGRPEGVLLSVLAVAAGYASGRILGALLPVAAPVAGALAGVGLAIAAPYHATRPQFGTPLGNMGAVAALLTLATGAACCAAWAARRPAQRFAMSLGAAGITVTAAVLGSTTGLVACVGVLLCSLAADRMRHRAPALAAFALVSALVTAAAWAVAEQVGPHGLDTFLEDRLSGHRVLLWRDALTLAHRNPASGGGPGRFAELSTEAHQSAVPDGRPHSALLQQAAEQGLPGAALLAAVYCWALFALWRTRRPTPIALTAGAALTALAVIASVGDALSFTTVTAGAGVLAGIATARPLADEREAGREEGQEGWYGRPVEP